MSKFICTVEGKSTINVYSNHAEVITEQGIVLIDLDDVDKAITYKWTISHNIVRDSHHTISLARLILGLENKKQIKYKNGNVMDCRKVNLYTVNENDDAKYDKHIIHTDKGYLVLLDYDGTTYDLGSYESRDEAKQAYDNKVIEIYCAIDALGFYR